MGNGRIRSLLVLPKPANYERIIHEFTAKGDGLIAARSPRRLVALRSMVGDDEPTECLEFGRLVARFARLAGEEPNFQAPRNLVIRAIAKVCDALPESSPFYGVRNSDGLHRRLAEVLEELKGVGLDSVALTKLASESERAPAKFASLAWIQSRLDTHLEMLGLQDHRDQIRLCLQSTPHPDVAFPPVLLFLDAEFDPLQREWIKWASSAGASIDLVAPYSEDSQGLFSEYSTMVAELGGEVVRDGAKGAFAEHLFTGNKCENPEISVRGVEGPDPLGEVEFVLRECLAKSQAIPYSRIGIFARNLEEYGPLLLSAAKRIPVPLSLPVSAPLLASGFARLVRDIVKALEGQRASALNKIARSTYLGFDKSARTELSEFLKICDTDNQHGWRAILERQAEEPGPTIQYAIELANWRKEAECTGSMSTWRGRLETLLSIISPELAAGKGTERDLRVRNVIQSSFAAAASVAEEPDLDLEQFTRLVIEIIEHETFLPPASIDGVQVRSSAEDFARVDVMYVVGMIEGSFPRRRVEDPILTDEDRRWLNDQELPGKLGDSFTKARRERDAFFMVCAAPEQELVIAYPDATDERDNVPAFYIVEIQRALGRDLEWRSIPRREFAPASGECLAERDRELRAAMDAPRVPLMPVGELSATTKSKLRGERSQPPSPKAVRTAWECPFRYFVENILSVYPDRDRRRWYQLRQIPMQSELLRQPDPISARSALEILVESELGQLRPHLEDWEFDLMRNGAKRLVDEWIQREFRSREVWPKASESTYGRTSFGSEQLRGELPRLGPIQGSVAGSRDMGPYHVVHLVESNVPSPERGNPLQLKDRDLLYYGIHMMASFQNGKIPALEIESMSGTRKLIVMRRTPDMELPSTVTDGLEVMDLSDQAMDQSVQEVFFRRLKDLLQEAGETIQEMRIQPRPGDHCLFCGYGELCRQSTQFGEAEMDLESGNE